MTQKSRRAASAIALLLVFSLSQLYVQANLAVKSPKAKTSVAAPARTGKLMTRGNHPVSLNGNSTSSGTTVLSGSELQTPAGVGASVQLGRNGLVRLAPETSLTLNFDNESIDVTLNSGYATLTTNEGIRGSITMPDGKTVRNDASKLSTIEGQTGDDDDDKKKAAGYIPGGEEGEGLLGGASNGAARAFGLAVLGGAIAATVIIINLDETDAVKAINPSPSAP